MKKQLLFFALAFIATNFYCQVGIGTTTPSPKAMLEVSSTSDAGITYKGFMPPRVPNITARDLINPSAIDIGLLVFMESIGCLQIWNGMNWENIYCLDSIPVEPWINEFHYDNIGADMGEFIEIAGPAGLDLSNYKVLFYNGADGATYGTLTLFGIIDNEFNNYGAISFLRSNIQNDMEGIALIKLSNNQVLQFISYEGSFIATNNTANGMSSMDIGFEESDTTTPIGFSLQLTGTGNTYGDFNWNAPADDSPGDLNVDQIIN